MHLDFQGLNTPWCQECRTGQSQTVYCWKITHWQKPHETFTCAVLSSLFLLIQLRSPAGTWDIKVGPGDAETGNWSLIWGADSSTPPPPPSPPVQRSTPPVPVLPSNPADQQGYEEEYPPFCREEFRSVRFYNLPFEHKGPGFAPLQRPNLCFWSRAAASVQKLFWRGVNQTGKKWGVKLKLLNFFSVVYVALSPPASASIIFYSYHKLVHFFLFYFWYSQYQ